MEEFLTMSSKERERLVVMARVEEQELTIQEAAELLALSYRQTWNIYQRYDEDGDAGLVHRSRGRPSNNAIALKQRRKALQRYRERYSDCGPTFAAEKLAADGYAVDHETLRRWLMAEGLWQKRRARQAHRKWRERRAHFGELVQMDGSPHRWFGPDERELCLLDMVDDATGITFALLDEAETIDLAMRTLWGWIERYGLPRALYVDHKNVYVTGREPTPAEQLAGERPVTHFGKACQKLGIQIIAASSPQAKGRVERKNGVHQDRLVKELRLAEIGDKQRANDFVRDSYLADLNKRFAVQARSSVDFHRPAPAGLDLRMVFCLEEDRQVHNDWTVRYQNRILQLLRTGAVLPRCGEKVTLSQWLDGSLHVFYKSKEVAYEEVAAPVRPVVIVKPVLPPRPKNKYIPPADHPWRNYDRVQARKAAQQARARPNGPRARKTR